MNYIILISTPDSRGLVHKISSNLLDFNIEKNDEFVDKENEYFFMRTEISVEDINSSLGKCNSSLTQSSRELEKSSIDRPLVLSHSDFSAQPTNLAQDTRIAERVDSHTDSKDLKNSPSLAEGARGWVKSPHDSIQATIESRLRKILPPQSFIKVTQKRKKSIVIFCTKEAHCLGDLLIKHYNNELDIDIKAVIANHADLGALVEKFHIPYFHISHDSPNFEDSMLEVCANFAPDFIVLAKYMRILSPHFIAHYENRIINIHHSFLPAFIGANPYKQAYTRGVKIIGATAHFVTSELDSGPIICQDIMQVNHTLSWRDMQKAGRNIERVVLARAVELAIDERIFIHKNKTIIF